MLVPTIHLKVVTQSGYELGKVCDVIWDSESQLLIQLKVKKGFLDRTTFLVHVNQIVRVEENRIVVEDVVDSERLSDSMDSDSKLKKFGKSQAAPAQRKLS